MSKLSDLPGVMNTDNAVGGVDRSAPEGAYKSAHANFAPGSVRYVPAQPPPHKPGELTHEEFSRYQEMVFDKLRNLGTTKGIEYAGRKDRFANFTAIAAKLDMPRNKVLWVYLEKHLRAIESYMREGQVFSEAIEGRIDDSIMYLILLRGMLFADQCVNLTATDKASLLDAMTSRQ